MSQDKSHLQVIEKFSFIYTLTVSNNQQTKQINNKVNSDIRPSTKTSPEFCRELVHASVTDSVTLSSVLGFTNFVDPNQSSLSVLNEPKFDCSLDLSQELEIPAPANRQSSFIVRHLGKIVFAVSSSYLIFVACWLAGHSYYGTIFPFSGLRSLLNISEPQVTASDLQFIDYLKRSLDRIELKENTKLSDSTTKPENSEVVYLPVYNLTDTNSASEKNASNSLVNNSVLPVPIIPPPPPQKIPKPTLPSVNITPKVITPQSTSTKSSSKSSSSSVSNQNNVNASTPSPIKNYTLIGIFELGKQSAALFKVDGITKRIWVGDKLDNKGWILDSVANQKAKISRQGEVRFLSVGERL